MTAARPLTRLLAVTALGVTLAAGCTNGGHPPKPSTSTRPRPTTTVPASNGLVGTKDFVAFVNAEPGSPQTLIVTGTVQLASPAYAARLVPANPQGFNPRILLMNLVVTKITENPVPAVVVERQVRFTAANTNYERVTILGAGPGLDLPVTIAR
jgi:hypothetical protein